jgi:hypothetical protein
MRLADVPLAENGVTVGTATVSASGALTDRDGTGGVRTAVATDGRRRGVAQTAQLAAESDALVPHVGHLIIARTLAAVSSGSESDYPSGHPSCAKGRRR